MQESSQSRHTAIGFKLHVGAVGVRLTKVHQRHKRRVGEER